MIAIQDLIAPIRRLHERMRGAVLAAAERSDVGALAQVAHDEQGDTLYAIDRVSEERMLAWCEEEIARLAPCVVIAEGLSGGRITLPRGVDETQARFRILIDPLDGTRGLMYQKRSAWILTGVAPNRGAATTLADIELAVQTEVPLLKQHLCDTLWALRGRGAQGERFDLVRGAGAPLTLRPSQADTIAHGFAMIARFFPGMREELAAIDEEIVRGALGPARRGKAHCFEDQYISTGGQLYELMAGHDRFVADLRPLIEPLLASRGLALGICCHPYDLATELIARELGVIVVDPFGAPLSAPLTVEAEVAWAGYANAAIRAQIEPLLQAALRRRGLAPSSDGRHLRAEPQAG